jgi:hypothetical protein
MFKKLLLLTTICTLCAPAFAADSISLPYSNLKNGSKITFSENGSIWSYANKKSLPILIKQEYSMNKNYIELSSKDGNYWFAIDSQYTFLNKGSLIGYSNSDFKFYEYTIENNTLNKRSLQKDEVQALLKKYKVIAISDFSEKTNSLKIKKKHGDLNILILNDTDTSFNNYEFTSNNAEFETYDLAGFIKVTKKGMIQFSPADGSSKSKPWYILLVR